MSIYIYGSYDNFRLLKLEIRSRKGGHEYVHAITLDSDKEYFHEAWREIQAMEACQQYGIANYKVEF